MKTTDLPKNGHFSGRINKTVKESLKTAGITVQMIVDEYIDNNIGVSSKIEIDVIQRPGRSTRPAPKK